MPNQIEDLTGRRFNKLTVIGLWGRGKRRRVIWLCKCDCGNLTKVVREHLVTGHTKSCGCRLKEIKNNIGKINYKNGLSGTQLSFVYNNMINRCYWSKSRSYKDYGARGIGVCKEWLRENNGFANFCEWALQNGYSDEKLSNGRNKLTLDRIDTNKDYSPDNCRWVDIYVQANNKRNTRKLKINGEIDTIANWSRRLNLNYFNLHHYANGGQNCKYPYLNIEVVNE